MRKFCPKCETEKDLEDFHKRSKSIDGRQSWCKLCNTSSRVKYYHTNEGNKKSTKRNASKAKTRNQNYVWNYLKDHPCVDCGETDIIVLQFDHINGNKVANVAALVIGGASLEKLKTEIEKCEVVCANDHMRRTAKQFGWAKVNMGT
jgi:hypothetical protein